jgi:hypothetical protein
MVHEKVLGKKLSSEVHRLSPKQLMVLLAFVLSLLSTRKRLTKAQRKSLAITENELKIRKQVLTEEGEIRPRRRGSRGKKKRSSRRNPRAARAMRYMREHKVSLKEAWKHV